MSSSKSQQHSDRAVKLLNLQLSYFYKQFASGEFANAEALLKAIKTVGKSRAAWWIAKAKLTQATVGPDAVPAVYQAARDARAAPSLELRNAIKDFNESIKPWTASQWMEAARAIHPVRLAIKKAGIALTAAVNGRSGTVTSSSPSSTCLSQVVSDFIEANKPKPVFAFVTSPRRLGFSGSPRRVVDRSSVKKRRALGSELKALREKQAEQAISAPLAVSGTVTDSSSRVILAPTRIVRKAEREVLGSTHALTPVRRSNRTTVAGAFTPGRDMEAQVEDLLSATEYTYKPNNALVGSKALRFVMEADEPGSRPGTAKKLFSPARPMPFKVTADDGMEEEEDGDSVAQKMDFGDIEESISKLDLSSAAASGAAPSTDAIADAENAVENAVSPHNALTPRRTGLRGTPQRTPLRRSVRRMLH